MDHASTTPIDREVYVAMEPYIKEHFVNPSSIYARGAEMKKVVEDARIDVARILGVKKSEVVFTGSGTESDNLAVYGVWTQAKKEIKNPHIVTTTIEHPAVLEVARQIEKEGGSVTYVPVDESGVVSAKDVCSAITEDTVLVSVMHANNEIGTIQPVGEIGRKIKSIREKNKSAYPFFHTDASQTANYLPIGPHSLGVDLLTLDASKIYGPKGVGVLVVRDGALIQPIMFGGGQEGGLRPGTENVAAIVGCARALLMAAELREKESERLLPLRDELFEGIKECVSNATLNGDSSKRLPNNVNICIPGLNAEYAVIRLDEKGIECSSASACKNISSETSSYVIDALGNEGRRCRNSSLRFTLGRGTTRDDISRVVAAVKELYGR